MKAKEISQLTTDEMRAKEQDYKKRIVQSSFPISHWSIGKHGALTNGSQDDCPFENSSATSRIKQIRFDKGGIS